MFPHCTAAITSLDASPTRVRSARFRVSDSCGAGGPADLVPGEQSTGECELGLWLRPKTADDSACATVCDFLNAPVPDRCLSADASSFLQNFSRGRRVKRAHLLHATRLVYRDSETPNTERRGGSPSPIRDWALDVGCSAFNLNCLYESAAFTGSKTLPMDCLLDRSGVDRSRCAGAHGIGGGVWSNR